MTSCSALSQYSSCSFRLNVPFPPYRCLCFSGAFSLAVSILCGHEKMWGPGFLGSMWSSFLDGWFYSLLAFLSLDVILSERQELRSPWEVICCPQLHYELVRVWVSDQASWLHTFAMVPFDVVSGGLLSPCYKNSLHVVSHRQLQRRWIRWDSRPWILCTI